MAAPGIPKGSSGVGKPRVRGSWRPFFLWKNLSSDFSKKKKTGLVFGIGECNWKVSNDPVRSRETHMNFCWIPVLINQNFMVHGRTC